VFNHLNGIVTIKLTPGNASDASPVLSLVKELSGKLFGDYDDIGKKLAGMLLRQGLVLLTRVHKNMKSLPMTLADKTLLNARNIAETIIGHIKAFSSFNLPKHPRPSIPSSTSSPHSPPISSIPSRPTIT